MSIALVHILITTIAFLGLLILGVYMPSWHMSSMTIYAGLWISFGCGFVYFWFPGCNKTAIRIAAGILGLGLTASAIDFLISQYQSNGSYFQLRSPIVGFVIVGLPSLIFAATGRSKHVDAHEQTTECVD